MNRKQRRAAERRGAGFGSAPRAASEAALGELFAAASARHRAGALAEAEHRYRHILSLFPDHAETHGMLAVALFAQGKIEEAVVHFERTVALRPTLPGAFDDLGKAYLTVGKPELAIQAAGRALELEETERRKMFFAYCAKSVTFSVENARLRKLVVRALGEGWARPRDLTRVCVSLVTLSAVLKEAIARAQAAWPQRLGAAELVDSAGLAELARDELLCRLLQTDPVTDLGLERLLANLRHAMLASAYAVFSDEEDTCRIGGQQSGVQRSHSAPGEEHDPLLAFYCSIARQCFINDFVFSKTEDEDKRAQELRTALEVALAAEQPVPALWPVVVGAYFPLHALANASALLARTWPACVGALIVQQISEPAEERRIAAAIPALTVIEGEVSRLVRQQYEENPYPRWVTAGPAGRPAVLHKSAPEQTPDVLIAGCGTGLSATEFARDVRGARILAIDLSLASLAYAKRMAQKFRLTNIEFAQADIMKLGTLGRQFDFIDASGVLHHLAEPWEGWQILLSLLRPGGAMEVGLYSAQARRNVVAGRALIAQRSYRPTPDDIRRCREDIAAAADGSLLKTLTQSDDFFTVSECRDMLFHPQEHRLTLPQIQAFLAATDLQFMGFALPPPVLRRFALRFPSEAALTDLACWHAFECEAPETFGGMYLFTVRKPAPQ
jgi:SAM-dependent methyltransferase/tetratricopeptide (TPR) repeat protein